MRLGQVGDQCGRDATSLLAVPALDHAGCVFEVGRSNQDRIIGAYHARATGLAQRQGQRSAMAPDNVGALKTEVALLESSRLAGNPLAVRRDNSRPVLSPPRAGKTSSTPVPALATKRTRRARGDRRTGTRTPSTSRTSTDTGSRQRRTERWNG